MGNQPNIMLRDITRENWRACARLKPAPDQEQFVASNPVSLAQAAYETEWIPQAMYDGKRMVGFIMYGLSREDNTYWVLRLMVAAGEQRKGYGRAALGEAIRRMAAHADCHEIAISYEPENHAARTLYLSMGFREHGEMIEDEAVARLTVQRDGAST